MSRTLARLDIRMISGTREKTYIAGGLTVEDWESQKKILTVGGSPDPWANAFENFFLQRLRLRYFRPIQFIQKNGDWQGEGFSMVSLQCALIEFLAATRKGMNYRYLNRGEVLGNLAHRCSHGRYRQKDCLLRCPAGDDRGLRRRVRPSAFAGCNLAERVHSQV